MINDNAEKTESIFFTDFVKGKKLREAYEIASVQSVLLFLNESVDCFIFQNINLIFLLKLTKLVCETKAANCNRKNIL